MSDLFPKGWHDMGGDAAGPIDRSEHDFALWEKRVDALWVLSIAKGVANVDALRRSLEDLGEDAFERLSYYDRWIAAVNRNLIESGVYTPAELAMRMATIRSRGDDYAACSLQSDGR